MIILKEPGLIFIYSILLPSADMHIVFTLGLSKQEVLGQIRAVKQHLNYVHEVHCKPSRGQGYKDIIYLVSPEDLAYTHLYDKKGE